MIVYAQRSDTREPFHRRSLSLCRFRGRAWVTVGGGSQHGSGSKEQESRRQ
jgi:hypothetical protein